MKTESSLPSSLIDLPSRTFSSRLLPREGRGMWGGRGRKGDGIRSTPKSTQSPLRARVLEEEFSSPSIGVDGSMEGHQDASLLTASKKVLEGRA
ncbi:hypothetical protein AVEN_196144-1 [Araneus ventricosus]|uniref:Uncharacterized protein n=1 Tax=Araneus ventricosus TaxID=182803 RepID=A0A4Y2E0X8_ARAVE|nr:hypothetical protein AVEN_196144-1 [Araneus ventricosus]